MELLAPDERELVGALLINRFRGDRALLDPLPEMIAERTGVPVAGVVPFVYDLQVKDEDGVTFGDYDPPGSRPGVPRGTAARDQAIRLRPEQSPGVPRGAAASDQAIRLRPEQNDVLEVAVIGLPRVSNHDDLDPFRRAGCRVRVVTNPHELPSAHVVIIPGSKSTIADLRWMKSRGLDTAIADAAKRGTTVVGICGGYQILGEQLDDPDATESGVAQSESGLGLLPIRTVFATEKTTRRVGVDMPEMASGPLEGASASGFGYEIHTGVTTGAGTPLVTLTGDGESWPDGSFSSTLPVIGSYVHGLFDSPDILRRLLDTTTDTHDLPRLLVQDFSMEAEYDRLAQVVREALDMDLVRSLIE
jgi:adenosylcobyric acid synthase